MSSTFRKVICRSKMNDFYNQGKIMIEFSLSQCFVLWMFRSSITTRKKNELSESTFITFFCGIDTNKKRNRSSSNYFHQSRRNRIVQGESTENRGGVFVRLMGGGFVWNTIFHEIIARAILYCQKVVIVCLPWKVRIAQFSFSWNFEFSNKCKITRIVTDNSLIYSAPRCHFLWLR